MLYVGTNLAGPAKHCNGRVVDCPHQQREEHCALQFTQSCFDFMLILLVHAGSIISASSGPWYENGELLMLLAAQSMAAGTLMVPLITKFVDPVVATGWHMILGGVPLVGLSLLTEQQELATNLVQINAGALASLHCAFALPLFQDMFVTFV